MAFARLRSVYGQFEARHRRLARPGFPLFDETGTRVGHVDSIGYQDGRLRVIGWTTLARIVLVGEGGPAGGPARRIRRADVAEATDADVSNDLGFEVEAPRSLGTLWLSLGRGQRQLLYPVPPFRQRSLLVARAATMARFAGLVASLAPSILQWRYRRSDAARAAIVGALGLHRVGGLTPLDPDVFATKADHAAAPTTELAAMRITIIVPVYNAFDLLPEVLDRLVRHTDVPFRLLVVEDCSPDPAIRPWLRDWAARPDVQARGAVEILENETNLGFIRSVNRALEEASTSGDHVVLVNSDAFVPAGWASRLMRPIVDQPAIASVTPMSNDAEIFSVPVICVRAPLAAGQAERIDAAARLLSPRVIADAPTGVGFCMAMNAAWLARVPALDTAFGRGYGEEVDWCRRTLAMGARHVGIANLFVEHRGGTSFGSEAKRALLRENGERITRRYPNFDGDVQHFIQADPLVTARLALAIAALGAAARRPMPIYLAHSWGGGAESYLKGHVADDIAEVGGALVLRVGGARRWRLEAHAPEGVTAGDTDDFTLIDRLLDPIANRRIVYSCGVGDPDPVAIPERLLALCRPGSRLTLLLHDYFPVSPAYTLLDAKGRYRGPPEAASVDPAHNINRPDGTRVTLADWREAWGRLIGAADRVEVFSSSSLDIVTAAYPRDAARMVIAPHRMPHAVPELPAPASGGRVIGVLGDIGYQKGAAVLQRLAQRLARANDGTGLVIVGRVDPAWPLPPPAVVHGAYRLADLPEIVARHGITEWLMPSVWPETFSFAVREALATGFPVTCFDLGAQAEAVRAAPNGTVLPFADIDEMVNTVLAQIPRTDGQHGPALDLHRVAR